MFYALFTFLLPLINFILYKIIIKLYDIFLNNKFTPSEYNNKNCVFLSKVIEYAAIENNSILYKEYKKMEDKKNYYIFLSNISFCVLFLLVLNFFSEYSIIHYLIPNFNYTEKLTMKDSIFLLIFSFFCYIWYYFTFNNNTEWIYSPKLAKLLNTHQNKIVEASNWQNKNTFIRK